MFKLLYTFTIIIYLTTSVTWAKSNICTQYLTEQSSNEKTATTHDPTAASTDAASDDFRHSRVWQEFALTNPKGSISIEAKAKLVTFYEGYISQEVHKFAATQSLNLDQQNQLNEDLKIKVMEWIGVWQSYIYTRFEAIKTFRESNPSFYQQEILALREIIENTPGWLGSRLQNYLYSSN